MVEIRVRHEGEIRARRLGEVAFDQLETVIPTIDAWGIVGEDFPDDPQFAGQFVLDVDAAYFEVVVSSPDED